jgi:hypothetical protein
MMVISYKKKGETQILLKIDRRNSNKKETNVITFYFYATSFVLRGLSVRDGALFQLLF